MHGLLGGVGEDRPSIVNEGEGMGGEGEEVAIGVEEEGEVVVMRRCGQCWW